MIHRDTDIVSAFRSLISKHLGDDTYDIWFSTVEFAAESDGIEIRVDNGFTLERLRKSHQRELQKLAAENFGSQFEVKFSLQQKKSNGSSGAADSNETTDQDSKKLQTARQPVLRVVSETQSPTKPRGRKFANLKSFVAGDCNRMGIGSAKLIMENLGSISPFFIHGPNGAGKTHLLEGIWSAVRKSPGRCRVIYLSAEQFTTYFLQALKGGGLPGFRQKYRGVDCLIIDDVQFFVGKQATIVELLHTIDSNLREGGQLVLAADRPISELHQLGGELTARLASGLSCELTALDLATRKEVLRGFALARKLTISDQLLGELSALTPGDGRQLSGVINRIWVTNQVKSQTVDSNMVREVVSELFTSSKSMVRLMDIERVVCDQFGIDSELLKSDNRTRCVSHPRMMAMWLARKYTRAALAEISEFFGRRSHSTVVSAQNKVDSWVADGAMVQLSQQSCDIRDVVRQLERELAVG